MAKMKLETFLSQCDKALKSHTVYATGAFGASIGDYPDQKTRYSTNMYNTVYKQDKADGYSEADAKKDAKAWAQKVVTAANNPPCWAFDCVGLVKGIIWGWNAVEKHVYGGAVYKSNGLDDIGAGPDGLISKCTDVSTDFSKIVPGELLWLNGHVGIYVGDGMAIECTTAWDNNVQKVECWNVKKTGRGRAWTKHGKLSTWVDYSSVPPVTNKFYVEIGPLNSSSEAISMQSALKTLGTASTIITKAN